MLSWARAAQYAVSGPTNTLQVFIESDRDAANKRTDGRTIKASGNRSRSRSRSRSSRARSRLSNVVRVTPRARGQKSALGIGRVRSGAACLRLRRCLDVRRGSAHARTREGQTAKVETVAVNFTHSRMNEFGSANGFAIFFLYHSASSRAGKRTGEEIVRNETAKVDAHG